MKSTQSVWEVSNYVGWVVLGALTFFLIAWAIPLSTSIIAPLPLIILLPSRLWLTHRAHFSANKHRSILAYCGSSVILALLIGGIFQIVCFYDLVLPYTRFFWTSDIQCSQTRLVDVIGIAWLCYAVVGGILMWASSVSDTWEMPRMTPAEIAGRFAKFEQVSSIIGFVTLPLFLVVPIVLWEPVIGITVGWFMSGFSYLMTWSTFGLRWSTLFIGLLTLFVPAFVFPSLWIGTLVIWQEVSLLGGFSNGQVRIDQIVPLSLLLALGHGFWILLYGFIFVCNRNAGRGRT